MLTPISSIHETDDCGQTLVNDVVHRFVDLLIAGGASTPMIKSAFDASINSAIGSRATATFTELGSILRDCMEVMCVWRRETGLVNDAGEPRELPMTNGMPSFVTLCETAGCNHPPDRILAALIEFEAVKVDSNGLVMSLTPTFLLRTVTAGGRIATDGVIKQLSGFLRCVHTNICSVSGVRKSKFERACTVTVAAELEPIFDRVVRNRGQEFIDSIDEWLERSSGIESPSHQYVEVGAGAYSIEFGAREKRARRALKL